MKPKYEPQIHVVLHQPEIPPNTGAIGRTCVALQAKLWLIKPLGFEITEKTLRRAGLDYWQHLEWEIAENWEDFLSKRQPERMWLFSRFAQASYLEKTYELGRYAGVRLRNQGPAKVDHGRQRRRFIANSNA